MSFIACLLLVTPFAISTQKAKKQSRLPIIDMHGHAMFFKAPKDFYGNEAGGSAEEVLEASIEQYRKYNVVKAVISGTPEMVEMWKSQDEENRFIRGIFMVTPSDYGMTPERFEEMVKNGKVEVLGELVPMVSGQTICDPEWQPYLKICEKYDIPCSVHTGQTGANYHRNFPKIRLALGDPYLIEDMLKKYPKLRVYIAHAGFEWYDHAATLMHCYPNLYTDLGSCLWWHPRVKRFAKLFLVQAQEGKFLDRVMFGTDAYVYPHAIGMSIEYLSNLDFLSEKDKRDILYNNATRFLKLKE